MAVERPDVEAVFHAARQKPPRERGAYLDHACGGDPAVRRRVEQFLAAQAEMGSFLDSPAPELDATRDLPGVTERPGAVIGPYKLLEPIGEGGFGVVFLAEQTEPVRRKVALKILKPGMDTRQVVARFEAERQALAIMDHPNIARVHDGGVTADGRPYFVMELVKGAPITRYCDDHRLTPRQRLELFVPVCHAIQHAHQKGVIHRDVKPSNVLVALYDDRPVPKVIDFGVAKAVGQQLTEQTLLTGFGALVGTVEYMSPEQAGFNQLDVDTRSDIYSLGVLLYELLTGSPPFARTVHETAGMLEMLRAIREQEPPRPSSRLGTAGGLPEIAANRGTEPAKLTRLVRGELDWIVMKALEKDRGRRYETANGFAQDLQRYLSDEPVQACPPSAGYRLRKFARRHQRTLVMTSALALAALVGVGALAVSTALVWKANKDLKDEAYYQRITVAHRELSTDNLTAALRALDECPEDLRGWEWHYLMRLGKVDPLVIPAGTEVTGVAFSPDGERLASAGGDGAIRIWNSRTGKPVLEILGAHDKAACSVVFHPDGKHLASAGADRLVKVWDLETRKAVFQGPCDAIRRFGASCTVAFRPPDGRHLAAGCDGMVRVWDWTKNPPESPDHTFPGPDHDSIPVAFTRDGRCLATSGGGQQGLNLWDVDAGRLLRSLPAGSHPVTALAFSADGGRLAAASLGRSVSLWDTTTGDLLRAIPHTGNVLGVAFNPVCQRIASAGEDKTVHVGDAATGRAVLGLHGHTDMCGCVAFSPDGRRLVSASHDGTISVWDATPLRPDEGQEALTFTGHDHEVRSIAVSPPDGRWVASGGNGTPVKVWDAATGRVSLDFTGHAAPVFSAAWHPDGRRVATAGSPGRQNTVQVWDPSDGRVSVTIPVGRDAPAGPYQVVAFSPDGRHLVTGTVEGAVEVWDAGTGRKVRTLGTHVREVRGLVFSRDGRHLASASGDGTVKLWDATRLGGQQEPRLTLPARVPGPSVNVAFSPDGRRLVTGGEGYTVKIWDVETGRELHTLWGHTREVYAVAFSPNAECPWVASGGEDSRVNVWDSWTGRLIHSFRGHTGLVSSLAFSPDGRRLYSGSRDTSVKVWDLTQLGQASER